MAGKGWQAKHSLLNSTAGKHSRWTLRPAQASKQNDTTILAHME